MPDALEKINVRSIELIIGVIRHRLAAVMQSSGAPTGCEVISALPRGLTLGLHGGRYAGVFLNEACDKGLTIVTVAGVRGLGRHPAG